MTRSLQRRGRAKRSGQSRKASWHRSMSATLNSEPGDGMQLWVVVLWRSSQASISLQAISPFANQETTGAQNTSSHPPLENPSEPLIPKQIGISPLPTGQRGIVIPGKQVRLHHGCLDPKPLQHRRVLARRCLLYTSPSPRDVEESRMPSSA